MGMIIYSAFWVRVKALIKAHKMSYEEFSAAIGIKLSTIKSWMHFCRIPDAYTTFDIAKTLGVSMEYLVMEKEKRGGKRLENAILKRKTVAANIRKMAQKIEKEAGMLG